MYRYLPHNGVLGLWVFCGYVGFVAQWLLLVVGLFFAARTYRHACAFNRSGAALCSVAAIVIYMIGAYGDTVLGSWSGVFIVAPALAVSGKLAVVTGAWPRSTRAGSVRAARFGARSDTAHRSLRGLAMTRRHVARGCRTCSRWSWSCNSSGSQCSGGARGPRSW